MSDDFKSNAVLAEQIKMLFEISKEIKEMLHEMKWKTVSKEEMEKALQIHEIQSKARHDKLEADITILKRIIYTLVAGVVTALGKSFAWLFSLIIK